MDSGTAGFNSIFVLTRARSGVADNLSLRVREICYLLAGLQIDHKRLTVRNGSARADYCTESLVLICWLRSRSVACFRAINLLNAVVKRGQENIVLLRYVGVGYLFMEMEVVVFLSDLFRNR